MIVMKNHENETEGRTITLSLSRGTAILLLIIYALYLWFQLRTHHNLFGSESAGVEAGPAQVAEAEEEVAERGQVDAANPGVPRTREQAGEAEHEAAMSPWSAAAVLVVTTVLVSVCADYLVESIDSLVERGGISRSFIGLILIPIVGNAAEHVTAVVVAIKNKMDLVSTIITSPPKT
jgi:Ca2+:H+ antiporter